MGESDLFQPGEGGSTITQQLAKNIYFTQEKKQERKIAEVFMAFALENQYEKDDILELYVNTIYFGSGYYGVYDAIQGYFGKEPSDMTDYEALCLQGSPMRRLSILPMSIRSFLSKYSGRF
jgi:membrane peptidoglycan carboxypeptidase